MENKQTAVEWLYNHLFPKQLDGFSNEEWDKIDKAFEKAKQMEETKEYETKAFWFGRGVLAGRENRINELKPTRDEQ